jgi:transcriptional regulator NrdR family protein
MASTSVARETTPEEIFLEKIEWEISRLREKRPALSDRIDRAVDILLTHLSCPGQRVVCVRVGLGGRPKFVFKSLNERGASYIVNPSVWACSCPAFHRRGGPCKHSLAAWLLWRVAQPAIIRKRTCDGCDRRYPAGEMTEVTEAHDSLTWFPGDLLCPGCLRAHGGIA